MVNEAPCPASWIIKKQNLTFILYLNNLIAASERAEYQFNDTLLAFLYIKRNSVES